MTDYFDQINERKLKIILLIIAIIATLWVQLPRLTDLYGVDEDFRSFYWMNRFQQQGLFQNDQLRGHTYTTINVPWGELPLNFRSLGYNLLFYFGSFLVPPPLFSKLIPFLLLGITVLYLYKYGKSINRRKTGLTVALAYAFLNLSSGTSLSVLSGLQRGFACTMMIILIYYLHTRKFWASAIVVFVSSLFYPPMFLLGTVTSGLFYLLIIRNSSHSERKIAFRGLFALMISLVIGVLIISPAVITNFRGAIKTETSNTARDAFTSSDLHVLNDARFGPSGRNPLFDLFPIIGLAGLVTKTITAIHLIILMVVSSLIFMVRRPRHSLYLPRELWCLLLASLGLFSAAWLSAFVTGSFFLYLPSRYSRVGLYLFFSLFVFLNAHEAMIDGGELIRRKPRVVAWLILGVEIALIAFIILYPASRAEFVGLNLKWPLGIAGITLGTLFLIMQARPPQPNNSNTLISKRGKFILIGITLVIGVGLWGAYARTVNKPSTLNPAPAERELLNYLVTLPKDILIAGSPCSLDSVTLFAKRQILFSCEHISSNDQMMLEALDAYYAQKPEVVVNFCDNYSVDYLVIDSRTYRKEFIDHGWLFFEPQNQQLLPAVQSRDTFAMAQVRDEAKIFEADYLFVVPCSESALEY